MVILFQLQIEEFKSKMESTVMELKSKLSDSCNALTHLQDENKVLRDKIAEKETKNIKVRTYARACVCVCSSCMHPVAGGGHMYAPGSRRWAHVCSW